MNGNTSSVGAQHAAPQFSNASEADAHVSAYAAFEKAANEDLERSVGAVITRTIEQALPNLMRSNSGEKEGARQGVTLRNRLGTAVRQDVEAALKGDRQLGEQIAQILSARHQRLDAHDACRAPRRVALRRRLC